MPSFAGKRDAATAYRSGLQPGSSLAVAGAGTAKQELVSAEFRAAVHEDGRAAGQACSIVLVAVGRGTPEP